MDDEKVKRTNPSEEQNDNVIKIPLIALSI